jgi:serine/threonine protein kinase
LCNTEGNANIVQIFRLRKLHETPLFVDMELCDMTLETYIKKYISTSSVGSEESLPPSLPRYIKEVSSDLRASQIWNIMGQIANGLSFIHLHGQVHRDLKPGNGNFVLSLSLTLVLYPRNGFSWKIVDFGITSQGTSRTLHPTTSGRGTSSYRAPELLKNFVYNNKDQGRHLVCWLYFIRTRCRQQGIRLRLDS